jgi:hypothetical protein
MWIKMLHEKNAVEMNQLNDLVLPALFKALSDNADDVVLVDLQVLALPSLLHVPFSPLLSSGDLSDLPRTFTVYSGAHLLDSSLRRGSHSPRVSWFSHHSETVWQSRLHFDLPDSGADPHHEEGCGVHLSLCADFEFDFVDSS